MKRIFALALCAGLCPLTFAQQEDRLADWVALLSSQYSVVPNVVYKRANGFDCKLDVIFARTSTTPRPTLIYIHGGGWMRGSKESSVLNLLPYLAKGMNVVNVGYRLAEISLAPAAVEDCRCALRWVYGHAKEYGFDLNRLVVSGHSAGGHLSLMTGMLDPSAGFDFECPGDEPLKVAAIVNFFGITDVADVLEGPHRQTYAVRWLGGLANKAEIARRASPLTYVRADLPAVLTIHGDADTAVPYSHATRLHEALARVGSSNELLTIPGGRHGGFNPEDVLKIQKTIFAFLKQHGILDAE